MYKLAIDADYNIASTFNDKHPSTRHVSKELITSLMMAGWRVQKMSAWQQSLDNHILQLEQVTTRNKVV